MMKTKRQWRNSKSSLVTTTVKDGKHRNWEEVQN